MLVTQAISNIVTEMPGLAKTLRQKNQDYMYRGVEQISEALKPLLAKHGVVIVPNVRSCEMSPALDAKPGWYDTVLQIDWSIYGPDGDYISATTVGVGRDNSDKGSNKAHSQAYKYLVVTLFSIADDTQDTDVTPATRRDAKPAPTAEEVHTAAMEAAHVARAREVFDKVRDYASDPVMVDALKALAAERSQRLTFPDFVANNDWCSEVASMLELA